ncbi:hypothetical protein LCGC14_2179370 [marine sediment metagenome]|uniref:Uncharacterized protein n=1 Tax=marine sediment metagenome TaxID=412755 RepID=A0A0F9E9X4_9ZZZZ
MGKDVPLGQQLRAAMHRVQDEDWERWTPKQRQRARENSEYYGKDRDMSWLFNDKEKEPR